MFSKGQMECFLRNLRFRLKKLYEENYSITISETEYKVDNVIEIEGEFYHTFPVRLRGQKYLRPIFEIEILDSGNAEVSNHIFYLIGRKNIGYDDVELLYILMDKREDNIFRDEWFNGVLERTVAYIGETGNFRFKFDSVKNANSFEIHINKEIDYDYIDVAQRNLNIPNFGVVRKESESVMSVYKVCVGKGEYIG